ncbi:Nrxn3a protein-like [Scleropages formosus]|uniref:Nrxn3a protein-like n=1 Tax=Scleropages formosus TaxID=113540 RepID=A0A0N8K370_SCLFO|nr:Nrxn3a protein-like [Scleropages formosus]
MNLDSGGYGENRKSLIELVFYVRNVSAAGYEASVLSNARPTSLHFLGGWGSDKTEGPCFSLVHQASPEDNMKSSALLQEDGAVTLVGCDLVHLLLSTFLGLCLGLEFMGAPGQWARYLRWDASTRSDLSFQFKTDSSTALLLYFDDGGYCDFLQLMVVEGKLQLRFSIDCAETTIVSDKRVNDSNWHFVMLSRYNLRTVLSLDSETKAAEVRPQRQYMKIVSDLFLGGVPQDIRSSALTLPLVKEQPPFKGVIMDFKYSNQEPRLLSSQRVGLDMEGLCSENPCENGGSCSVVDGEPLCDCSKTEYVGRFCNQDAKNKLLAWCICVRSGMRCGLCPALGLDISTDSWVVGWTGIPT